MRIVAMGMSSCLGPLVTACAAFRAGITRYRPSVYLATFSSGDGDPQPVNVCEIPSVTLGFEGVGRLVAITIDALEDLGTRISLESLSRESGLFLAIPDLSPSGGPLGAHDSATAASLGRQILERAFSALRLSWPENRWRFFTGGSAGFALALAAARQAIERRLFDTVVVGGIDSLVGPDRLRSLLMEGRLKTADNPVGLTPGEAGALLVLRTRTGGSPGKTELPAEFTEIHSSFEPCTRASGHLPGGAALASCMQAAIGHAPDDNLSFICDLTGEQHRAWEWGCALIRLNSHAREARTWVPATGFGYVGAASGAIGACLAVHAFERRYAPGPHIIVVSQSDSGERAAFALTVKAFIQERGAS